MIPSTSPRATPARLSAVTGPARPPTAVVYREAARGAVDGEHAIDLARHAATYEVLSVIDAGALPGDAPHAVPVCRDLADAITRIGRVPDAFVFDAAPASGRLSGRDRGVVLEALFLGMHVVIGGRSALRPTGERPASGTHGP